MPESLPPLPELAVGRVTKMDGIKQEDIDRVLRMVYENRPDFYTRMAKREGSKDGGPNDEFVQEVHKYIHENLSTEMDVTITSVMTAIFWEMRRRARLMYGLQIKRVIQENIDGALA